MSTGWECPRCGDVYGPAVEKCTNPECKRKVVAEKQPGELGDPISDEELHDMIYAPGVRQFADGTRKKKRGGGGNGGDQSDGSSGVY